MTAYMERDIIPAVLSALRDMPVVVITGMRQVGKSTLLREQPQLAGRHYITLDDFAQLEAARENPDFLLNSGERLSIDELQKCPELLIAIKRDVDRKRRPGRYLLSGSANFALLKKITESLAGRAIYFDLLPFSRREKRAGTKQEPFLISFAKSLKIPRDSGVDPIKPKEIALGGLPVVCLGVVKHKQIWFKGYEQTYLERDLRELSQVDDLVSFRRLIHLAALRTGRLLRISELARDASMNTKTASRYLNLMETSLIIRRLEPFLANRASRLIKSPKLYIGDSGLGCFLAGIGVSGNHTYDPLWGGLFETYVAQNIAGIIAARWPQARLGFWNVQGRYEVDFVIEYGRDTLAIEVKWAERWAKSDLAGLRAFIENTPHCRVAILGYNGTDAVQLDEKLWAIPLGLLLS